MIDNNYFCIMPWVSLHVRQNGMVHPCCISDYKCNFGSVKDSTLKEIWNGENIKKFRKDLLDGKKIDTCRECIWNEEIGRDSLRQYTNDLYRNHFDIIEETKEDGTLDKLNLVYWDFRFSNVCNFKCRMCNQESSSSWGEEDKRRYEDKSYNPIKKIDIWEQLDPLYDIVEQIYFIGGEPLVMDEHYKIIDKLIKLKRYDVRLEYNTNFSIINYKGNNIIDTWKNFEDVRLTISLDGYSKKGEIIRNGLNWDNFVRNINELNKNFNHAYTIDCVVQSLNSFHVLDTHKELYNKKLINDVDDFNIYFLTEPNYLALNILPRSMRLKLIYLINDHINNFLIPNNSETSISQYQSMINYLNTEPEMINLIPKFKSYMVALDQIRNENTKKVFPELKDIWEFEILDK